MRLNRKNLHFSAGCFRGIVGGYQQATYLTAAQTLVQRRIPVSVGLVDGGGQWWWAGGQACSR
jgi:hypothetical protein